MEYRNRNGNVQNGGRDHNMLAAYGVYGDHEDGGFGPSTPYYPHPEHAVVVTSQRDGSTTNTLMRGGSVAEGCSWCWCKTADSSSVESPWYRPALLLLLLALLLIVFLLVSGALVYYNQVGFKAVPQPLEELCDKSTCSHGASCVTGIDGRATCRCPAECPSMYSPVCGTDGHTYNNLCALRMHACRSQENVRVQHPGECDAEDPCADKLCPVGARCVPTPDGRSASCVCPRHCPQYGDHAASRPVCGSDNVDYRDQCEMRRSACEQGLDLGVKYHGACDPCENLECVEPEVCQLTEDRQPVCRCGDSCSLEFTPVCGSDGKTYSNECTLRQESCRSRKTLRIIYRGTCNSGVNPCNSVICAQGEDCVISKFGIAACECAAACEAVVRPVCGSDAHTYDSVCHLRRAACLARTDLRLAHNGHCGASGPCSTHTCAQGAACVEKGGLPVCECPQCPAEFSPVCGSDGISYGNECKLRLESCQHMRNISIIHDGLCGGCENKKCEHFSVCETDDQGEARCVCPKECPKEESHVCGTDSVTYKNDCELRQTACEKKLPIQVAYEGECVVADLCKSVKCAHGARCESGICVCPTDCPALPEEPICASNMQTYVSECEMQRQACLADPPLSLTVVFYGDCNDRLAPIMTTTPLTPGVIPQLLPKATDEPREACSEIRCDYDASCELGKDGFPRCSCLFNCLQEPVNHVCGSDLRIYSSMCAMKMEACQRQQELRLRPLDLCQGMEVKPCNGEPPVEDPTNGQELDCGSGPNRQDCPSDSYCHQTSQFAKCCRKETGVYLRSCQDSWFGCCPDDKSPAQGPDNAGCPSMCGCNKIGSYSETCEPNTEQCQCKPGVGGAKCDRCEPGYWGLPKITSGHQGCLPCGCSMMGSVREDCEQMTGRCVCKPGVQGHKCDTCTDPTQLLGHNGCVSADSGEMATNLPSSCGDLTCFMGAVCEESGGQARCICTMTCPQESDQPQQMVCGSDGQTFGSDCQLKLYACRYQKDIHVQAMGACTEDMLAGTDWPVRPWTSGFRFTEPEDVSSPLSKSTRHLLVPESRHYYNRHGQEINHFITPGKNRGVFQLAGIHATPATVQVFTALLGDLCSSDSECSIPHSTCVAGACTCRLNYTQSSDRQNCIEIQPPPPKAFGCDSSPCVNGGTCEDLDSGAFICRCSKYFGGPSCADILIPRSMEVAAFSGKSYVRLKKLKAYHKLSIEIEFKTYTNDGILFYNQQHTDGTGDFVSLAIVNGFVEFRYNLGSGPVVLTSLERVQLHKYHRIIAKRYQRDGILQMDNSEAVAGQSQGTLRALDLSEDAFVGYVPTSVKKVTENIGTNMGLSGCIRRLKVGRKVVELEEGRDWMVEGTHEVRECGSNPCASLPCLNTATCLQTGHANFTCTCSPHYTGSLCETRIDPCVVNPCVLGTTCEPLQQGGFVCKCLSGHDCHFTHNEFAIPEFSGESYLEARKLENVGRAFALEVWFLSKAESGTLLYNGQLTSGKGDFIALNIINRHIQFRFNLGSGIANLTTSERIQLGTWHAVRASRLDKDGVLQLDNGTVVHGMSGPPLNELNLELPLYIGSVPNYTETNRDSGIEFGLVGSIQKLLVNGQSWTSLGLQGFKVGRFQGPPCLAPENPCFNNGMCLASLNTYICKCADGFSGDQCELSRTYEKPVKLDGNTFLEHIANTIAEKSVNMSEPLNLTNMVEEYWDENYEDYEDVEEDMDDMYDEDDFVFFDEHRNRRRTKFEVSLRTSESNGLLLWLKRGKNPQGNFVAVAINNGFPELNMKLGRHVPLLTVRSKIQVNDGEWHSLQIERWKRGGQIQVDNEVPIKELARLGKTLLNTNTQLWIGGAPSLPSGLPHAYYLNYNGCLQRLEVDKVPVNLLHLNTSLPVDQCDDR